MTRKKHNTKMTAIETPHYTAEEQKQRDGLRMAMNRIQSQESAYYQHRMGKVSLKERQEEKAYYQRIDQARKKKALKKLCHTKYSTAKKQVRFIKHNQ